MPRTAQRTRIDGPAPRSAPTVRPRAQAPAAAGSGDVFSRPPPLVHRAISRLLQDINTGVYQPGERIREEEVAQRLGISRGPVREALRVLGQDGVVQLEPWKGARVITLQADQAADVFELLAVAFGAVARLAARRATGAQLERYYRDAAKFARWSESGREYPDLVDLAYQMGNDLTLSCGSPAAETMVRKLARQAYGMHRFVKSAPLRARQQAVNRVRRLEAALRARSEPRSEKAARRIVLHTLTLLNRSVRAQSPEAAQRARA